MSHIARKSVLLALVAVFALAPAVATAGQLDADRAADVATVEGVLAHQQVADALEANGLTAQEVQTRLADMSDQDISRLADNLDQVQVAGNAPDYIWTLLAIILIIAIVAALL